MTTQTETEKFREMLLQFDTAVLVTHSLEGELRSRPMVVAQVDERCDPWFVTDRDSAKVQQIDSDTRVHVVCQKRRSICAAVSGRAFVVEDKEKIHELWDPENRIWFPKGPDDPNIVLIHVRGDRGEYWDNTGRNGWVYVYEAIKALMQGTVAEVKEGEQHGCIQLSDAR